MSQKQIPLVILIVIATLVIHSCKGKDSTKPVRKEGVSRTVKATPSAILSGQKEEIPKVKKELPRYVYKSSRRRDPFVPLVGKVETRSLSAYPGKVNISMLELKGLIWDEGKRYVLLKSSDGNAYVAGDEGLIDDRGMIVQGIATILKEEKVVLISKDNVIREFKFTKLREGSE